VFAIGRDNVYYAATNTGRVYVGPGGAGWQLGFTHPFGAAAIDLVMDNDDTSVVYGAFVSGDTTNSVFRLVHTGATVASDLSLSHMRALGGATGVLTANAIGSGVPSGLVVQTLASDAMRPAVIFAGTNRGVFRARSLDQGATWTWSDYNQGLPPADVRALRVQPTTGLLRAATFGRGAYQVNTDNPVGSLLTAAGFVRFLRVHDVGTGFGRFPNVLDAEVIALLDSQTSLAFGFQLRADGEAPTPKAMLDMLRAALVQNRRVSIDYVRTAPRVGTIIRVARNN
jgi:hypothetical protein